MNVKFDVEATQIDCTKNCYALALEFLSRLDEYVGYNQVNARARETLSGDCNVCYFHEDTDPNQIMIDAVSFVSNDTLDASSMDVRIGNLINVAWKLAQITAFLREDK